MCQEDSRIEARPHVGCEESLPLCSESEELAIQSRLEERSDRPAAQEIEGEGRVQMDGSMRSPQSLKT